LKGEIEKKNQFNKRTQKNQKNKDYIEKNNISQIEIEGCHWKQIKILQKCQKQKLEFKRIRTEIEILKHGTTLKFCMGNMIFKGRREKSVEKKSHWWQTVPPRPHKISFKEEDMAMNHSGWWFLAGRRCCTCCLVPYTWQPLFVFCNYYFLFIKISNCLLTYFIIEKKPVWKDWSALGYQFYFFKSFFVVSLCFEN